ESLLPPSPPLCKETRPFMAELKRLYKHIHPEVRKNIEADFLKSVEWDEILKGEVQSMRWMFENKPLDTIKDETPDENEERNIAQQEIIAGKDVRYTAWMFETQPMDALGTEATDSTEQSEKSTDLARGDVRTATWLFETQPLDYLNKIYQEDEQEMEVVVSKDITGGDVKTARYLFETQHLDSLGKTETIEESHFLNLKSELEEIKGEVKTTTRKFETQPMCVIRGDSGEMLEITTIRKEEMEKGDVKTSRWMFETQPLDMINKDPAKMKLICGISMEDNVQCGVNKGRWLFETKTLDSIKDEEWESSRKQKEEVIGADVRRHCLVFETQPMDTLKDNTNARLLPSEEIVGGDVQTAKHLFETVPMESLKELLEVGKLKKTVGRKKEITKTVNVEALDKGDVTNYKERFECMDLSKCEGTQKIQVEGVTSGSVKSNRVLFESTPMYAMQDSSGHYHEVKTVRREEIVKGDVRSCRWMFETRPIDEFDESINKFQIIKGISKQEIESGDVKTAKWLFETQQLDAIKAFSNDEDEEHKTKEEIEKGDVKTCKWLFETQPMDVLYEKEEKSEANVEEVQKGDVKTCTWLFETQTLDNIHDHTESESETILKTCTVNQEDIHGKDVRLARFLFETENLENLTGEDSSSFRRVTEIDVQSGDVSRMKYIFENQLVVTKEEIPQADVKSTTWLFETTPFHEFNESRTEMKEIIGKSIKETLEELYCRKMVDSQGILIEADEIGDVRMAKFQLMNQEAPEIQKEEIIRGDLSNIMMNLLNRRETTERGITIDEGRGDTSTQQLTIYSLLNKGERASLEKEDVIQGTVSKTLHRLLSNSGEEESKKIRVKDAERGNVSFYSTCIESGALDYLKQLQYEPDETQERVERERIIGGDIEETKIMLRKKQQIGRTPSWPPKEGSAQEKESLNQQTKPSLKETNIPAAGVQNGPQEDSTEQEGNNLKENEKRPEETPAESEAPTAEEPVNVSHTQESGESNSSCEAVAQVGAEMESEVQPDVDEKDQSEEAEGMQERVEEVKVNGHDGRIESAADEKASQEERDKGNNDGMKNGEAVKVTLIDEEATAGQALNANSNNNNSNSQILLDREILFEGLTEDDEEKHQSLFLTDAAGATDFFNADLCEESKWMPNEVLQLAQRDDAFVPAGAKCVEATDSFFPDMNFFTETAGGALAFQAEAAEQKISTSSFLEDIFAGLSTSSSSSGLLSDFKSDIFGRSVTETTTPTVSALDDLLDFGMEARGSTEKDVMETSHSAGGDGTRSLWAEEDDDEALTVEEQIKRNRYYDDDESDDS
uniref:Xin actin binding repeat containing 2a n=1 Tax=Labrus bergylta TaxID=56723 RepID=A0A3Q3LWA2_9LABR